MNEFTPEQIDQIKQAMRDVLAERDLYELRMQIRAEGFGSLIPYPDSPPIYPKDMPPQPERSK